ncbi:hypothetical protein MASR2M17_26130 [Aminivibrio sp.]
MDVGGLRALIAIHYVKGNTLTLCKGLKAIADNRAEMNEYVLALVRRNETVPFAIVKPLYCALTHPKTAS